MKGRIEKGETSEGTVKREIFEEANIKDIKIVLDLRENQNIVIRKILEKVLVKGLFIFYLKF